MFSEWTVGTVCLSQKHVHAAPFHSTSPASQQAEVAGGLEWPVYLESEGFIHFVRTSLYKGRYKESMKTENKKMCTKYIEIVWYWSSRVYAGCHTAMTSWDT